MSTVQEHNDRIETPQVIDRAYGTSYIFPGGTTVLLAPSRFHEGYFLAIPPSAKRRMLTEFQLQLQQKHESGEYVLPPAKQYLLSCSVGELKEAFRKAIHAEKGSYKLWASGTADIKGHVGHKGMTATVPSRRSARRPGGYSSSELYLVSPRFAEGVGIDYRRHVHGCEDVGFGAEKGAVMICAHAAAAIKAAFDEQSDPSRPTAQKRFVFDESGEPIYLPFIPGDIHSMFTVFRRYVMGENLKAIDKAELDNPDIYEPLFLDAITGGQIFYESLRQENRKIKPASDAERRVLEAKAKAMESFRDDYLHPALMKAGFSKKSLQALENKSTPFETPADTYERGDMVVRPVFNMDFGVPLLHVYRLSGTKDVFYKLSGDHPFAHIGSQQSAVDDRSRRKGTLQVVIPGPRMPADIGISNPFVHPVFHQDIRRLIAQNYQGNPETPLKELGLHRLV